MGIFDNTYLLSDLDGTLLDSNAEISYENRKALEYFMNNGGLFSFATGRNVNGMKYFMNEIPANAPGVVSNGAVIYDFPNDRVIKAFPVGAFGEKLAGAVMEEFPDVGIEVLMHDGSHVIRENEITRLHIKYTKMPYYIESADKISKPWIHMLLCREPSKIKELELFVKQRFGDHLFFQYSAEFFIEVLIKGVNKGTSAVAAANILGIKPDSLYTAGDGQNDVELIRCTKNAFAPKNSHEDVLKLSPGLLPSNDEHPIAALISIIEERKRNERTDIR
ncbi:MAG: HAD family hydrolase [Clostridia bacterium]|nr:HAD family hydrolase [Clostridia bacterium]